MEGFVVFAGRESSGTTDGSFPAKRTLKVRGIYQLFNLHFISDATCLIARWRVGNAR